INRALHRNPDHRFATTGELLVAFSHVLNERLRSPAYLSREQVELKNQPRSFPIISHEYHSASVQNTENHRYNKEMPSKSIDLPALSAETEMDSSTPEVPGRELILTETHLSGEHSLTENIHKMAQHVQILRERIQGEYNK